MYDGLLTTSHGIYGVEYSLLPKGQYLMTTVYLPIINPHQIPAKVSGDLTWLVTHSSREIYKAAQRFRR